MSINIVLAMLLLLCITTAHSEDGGETSPKRLLWQNGSYRVYMPLQRTKLSIFDERDTQWDLQPVLYGVFTEGPLPLLEGNGNIYLTSLWSLGMRSQSIFVHQLTPEGPHEVFSAYSDSEMDLVTFDKGFSASVFEERSDGSLGVKIVGWMVPAEESITEGR